MSTFDIEDIDYSVNNGRVAYILDSYETNHRIDFCDKNDRILFTLRKGFDKDKNSFENIYVDENNVWDGPSKEKELVLINKDGWVFFMGNYMEVTAASLHNQLSAIYYAGKAKYHKGDFFVDPVSDGEPIILNMDNFDRDTFSFKEYQEKYNIKHNNIKVEFSSFQVGPTGFTEAYEVLVNSTEQGEQVVKRVPENGDVLGVSLCLGR